MGSTRHRNNGTGNWYHQDQNRRTNNNSNNNRVKKRTKKRPLRANPIKTLRALVSMLIPVSELFWANHRTEGKSGWEIVRELGLPLVDYVRLYNLSDRFLEMALEPDGEGDIPMLDIDEVEVSGQNVDSTLNDASILLCDLIATDGKHWRRESVALSMG